MDFRNPLRLRRGNKRVYSAACSSVYIHWICRTGPYACGLISVHYMAVLTRLGLGVSRACCPSKHGVSEAGGLLLLLRNAPQTQSYGESGRARTPTASASPSRCRFCHNPFDRPDTAATSEFPVHEPLQEPRLTPITHGSTCPKYNKIPS